MLEVHWSFGELYITVFSIGMCGGDKEWIIDSNCKHKSRLSAKLQGSILTERTALVTQGRISNHLMFNPYGEKTHILFQGKPLI